MQSPLPSDEAQLAIAHNVAMLEGPLREHIGQESYGGNAGAITWEGYRYALAAANGYVERTTGRIIDFTNYNNPARREPERFSEITIMEGLCFRLRSERIFGLAEAVHLHPNARYTLAVAMEQVNAQRGRQTTVANRLGPLLLCNDGQHAPIYLSRNY